MGIADDVLKLQEYFSSGASKSLAWRKTQLKALRRMLVEQRAAFQAALYQDLRKSQDEAELTEIGFLITEIDWVLRKMNSLFAKQQVSVPITLQPGYASIIREPLGKVLIIAPWNYPVQLLLGPLIPALASGNTVALKPSEMAPATSALIAKLVPSYLDANAVKVFEGEVEVATALLAERWDHIFYTGSGNIGKVVLRAAAEHLTPVTLELGGKSPTWVDESVNLEVAAKRIIWAKFTNAGQTCIAPDYLLTTPEVAEQLIPLLKAAITEMFGEDPQQSESYGRIINERQFDRLISF